MVFYFLLYSPLICGILTLSENRNLWKYSAILGGSIPLIFIIIDVFILFKSVGLTNYGQFAHYLFGLSKYPYTLPYIPGLFDIYTAMIILELIIAIIINASRK